MKTKLTCIIVILLMTCVSLSAQIRVACIGNSITYGHGIEDREHDTYPAQLQALLGDTYEVQNFGVSGTTAQNKGDFPWVSTPEYAKAKAFHPNICVIKLGTNDSKPQNWVSTERFIADLEALAVEFESLDSHPQIIVCLPAKAFEVRWNIHDDIIKTYELPAIKKMAKKHHWPLINLYKTTKKMQANFPDGIHPNPTGAAAIAKEVEKMIKKVNTK